MPSNRTEAVTVNFTPKEKAAIRKKAGKDISKVSPFLRKVTLKALEIQPEEE